MSAAIDRLLIVSPHLDDAVFACGARLATAPRATVVTVFAGWPPRAQPLTEWDRACGFDADDDVIALRRAEDAAALALLDAKAVWLDFADAQYAATPPVTTIAQALQAQIDALRPATLLFPLGLFHSDHECVHAAVLRLLPHFGGVAEAYEDALYRRIDDRLDRRLEQLGMQGWHSTCRPMAPDATAAALKQRAVRCYGSQLRGLATPGRPGHADLACAEGYWRITRAAMN
jgi:LmbE family N-acetylglucosaminyl deacetylase